MKKISRIAIALSSTLFYFNTAHAAVPNNDHPTTFLGPTVRGGFTSLITDTSAYSLNGELGLKNMRVGGTVGWHILDEHALKISGEYLWQRINYAFFSGNDHEWTNQGAIGGEYQYSLNQLRFNPQLGLSAYYANASSISQTTTSGTYINSAGVSTSFTDIERVAGANASGISPGISISPWRGAKVGVDLNYDNVRYDMRYEPSTSSKGLGGTLRASQQLTNTMALGASAAVRQPFNHYQADLAWNSVPCYGAWVLKLVGAYTIGKNSLPNTYDIGLTADYFLDMQRGTREEDAKADFLAWMAKPAVYMPQILAIADENVT